MKDWMKQWRRLLVRVGLLPPAELHYIGGSDTLPPPLSREREAELLERIGEEDARKELIEHNLRLVVYIARRFENTGVGIEDLISIGTIGLIKAVNSFDNTKQARFSTYASRCIDNEVRMSFRKQKKAPATVSMNEPIEAGKDGSALTVIDVVPDDFLLDEDCERRDETARLRQLVDGLSGRQRQVVLLRYGLSGQPPMTQQEVADLLGISRSYISRIEKAAVLSLRQSLLEQER